MEHTEQLVHPRLSMWIAVIRASTMKTTKKVVLTVGVSVIVLLIQGCTFAATNEHVRSPRTFYVAVDGADRNDGRSLDSAFASFSRANQVARAGDTILVAPGTYVGKVVTSVSGRPGQRVTIRSLEPHGAKVSATGLYTAWENRGDYVDIVGFDISGSDYIGLLNYGSYVSVEGNEVHDLAAPSCNDPNGGAGIVHANYDATGNVTIGNVVHDIMADVDFCPLIHGIYQANAGGMIQNNIVYNITYGGIQLWHSGTATVVSNNLVWGTQVGVIIGGTSVSADHNLVNNNIVMKNNVGIQELGRLFGVSNEYKSNLVFDNGKDFDLVTGTPLETVYASPKMIDFQADGTGDYRLRPDSPGVDAGTPDGAPGFDIDGLPRPQLGAYDIGPYEFSPNSALSH